MSEADRTAFELAEIPGIAWTMLGRAVKDRRHGFRTPGVCTIGPDGSPRVRTVVLRHADRERLVLRCHTDRRAGKVEEIRREPRMAWLFYDHASRTQLRISALATIHVDGPVFTTAWENTALMSRRCYLAPRQPGSHADEPTANLPDDLLASDPDRERSEEGRANFAVVEARVLRMDWLLLKHSGHRRAVFAWDDGGELSLQSWVEP
jgi:hypothetical protein